ncbi:S9 family peptidase [Microbacterium sp. MPKO10]|uniref:alpha/beta hydrolase family protein n=1 Tax=Microbacterium sp. MPKO10 TaxID=2989818 RepID=UPI00223693CF|nr:lysophospholipase [Microbacterium sp. MPKO10]MCW4459583.1 lysophospholipase [Microbacterium sp. MPKO10]
MKRQCHADQSPRRWIPLALAGVGVTVIGAFAGVTAQVARTVLMPTTSRSHNTRVVRVDVAAGTITLTGTPDTLLPGRYGLWVNRSQDHLQLGDVVEQTPHTVTRRVLSAFPDHVQHGGASFSGWFYHDPRELGIDVEDWAIPTENGTAPAWYFPADDEGSRGLAVLVHGRGVTRHEVLRAVPAIRATGFDCLAVSYRNDGEAPESDDRRYGLGQSEWKDVDAALDEAARRGHSRFVLMGWSMGGALCLQAADRSRHADAIDGLVLESPVVDWRTVLRYQASASRIPALIRDAALWLLSHSVGRLVTGQSEPIDFDRLDRVAHAVDLRHPVLILHSDDDGFVPSDASHGLAEARPDLVTLASFDTARHTKLWNLDADRWARTIRDWLDTLPRR